MKVKIITLLAILAYIITVKPMEKEEQTPSLISDIYSYVYTDLARDLAKSLVEPDEPVIVNRETDNSNLLYYRALNKITNLLVNRHHTEQVLTSKNLIKYLIYFLSMNYIKSYREITLDLISLGFDLVITNSVFREFFDKNALDTTLIDQNQNKINQDLIQGLKDGNLVLLNKLNNVFTLNPDITDDQGRTLGKIIQHYHSHNNRLKFGLNCFIARIANPTLTQRLF